MVMMEAEIRHAMPLSACRAMPCPAVPRRAVPRRAVEDALRRNVTFTVNSLFYNTRCRAALWPLPCAVLLPVLCRTPCGATSR